MHTLFDFAAISVFAVLAVLYLQRSARPERDPIPVWMYALAAAACAFGNFLGNRAQIFPAVLLLAASSLFVAVVICAPFTKPRA